MRLSAATLARLPASVRRPTYERARIATGIVHLGIGAFHRAHQAVYTDDVIAAGDRDWGIVGVSLRSAEVARQMNPQDGLYSLCSRTGAAAEYRVIGAVRSVLVAQQQVDAVIEALAAASAHVVTFTITEKGYCSDAHGDLDTALADERSVYRYLAAALQRRRTRGLAGLTLLCCDNLAGNGPRLRRLLGQYLRARDAALADWVEAQCAFPSSMVDRIVPAATAADHAAARNALGLEDAATVATEPFSQWVIEDRFAGRRPGWELHGAEIVADVRPYETAKLRMLNGAHSALAYVGLLRGYRHVHEAVADAFIRRIVERLMREEAAPSVATAPGQDLGRYADALLERFANAALNHRLEQIAMDGSQKIPQRWLETLVHRQRCAGQCSAILTALAAWLLHVRGDARPVLDPLAPQLVAAWERAGADAILGALFGPHGLVAPSWTPTAAEASFVRQALADLSQLRR